MINVLKWNPGVVTHYDLIIPIDDVQEDVASDDDNREHKKVQVSLSFVEKVGLHHPASLDRDLFPCLQNVSAAEQLRELICH